MLPAQRHEGHTPELKHDVFAEHFSATPGALTLTEMKNGNCLFGREANMRPLL